MGKIFQVVFYFGLLFFGGGLLVAFGQFILYNGMGELFDYERACDAEITYGKSFSNKIEITHIDYVYAVGGRTYNSKETIATSSIEKKGLRIDEVYYNRTFPGLSYVGNNKLSLRKAKTGMIVMGFFFSFILLIYLLADRGKWIGVYTRGEYKGGRKDS